MSRDSNTLSMAIVSRTFTTSFALTENPISEGGVWTNGGNASFPDTNWNNVQTTGGNAVSAAFVSFNSGGSNDYNDGIAHIATSYRTWSPNQYVQGTVFRASGYTPTNNHEIELLCRFLVTTGNPGNARGYEVLWALTDPLPNPMSIVRWNGARGDYTPITSFATGSGPGRYAVNGDVVRVEITGNTLTVKLNGATVYNIANLAAAGTVWSTGQPGVGFFPRSPGATLASYGWSDFTAGEL